MKARKAGRSARKVETKKKEANSDEWLKGTYYNQVPSNSSGDPGASSSSSMAMG